MDIHQAQITENERQEAAETFTTDDSSGQPCKTEEVIAPNQPANRGRKKEIQVAEQQSTISAFGNAFRERENLRGGSGIQQLDNEVAQNRNFDDTKDGVVLPHISITANQVKRGRKRTPGNIDDQFINSKMKKTQTLMNRKLELQANSIKQSDHVDMPPHVSEYKIPKKRGPKPKIKTPELLKTGETVAAANDSTCQNDEFGQSPILRDSELKLNCLHRENIQSVTEVELPKPDIPKKRGLKSQETLLDSWLQGSKPQHVDSTETKSEKMSARKSTPKALSNDSSAEKLKKSESRNLPSRRKLLHFRKVQNEIGGADGDGNGNEDDGNDDNDAGSFVESDSEKEFNFNCKKCSKEFKTRPSLNRHKCKSISTKPIERCVSRASRMKAPDMVPKEAISWRTLPFFESMQLIIPNGPLRSFLEWGTSQVPPIPLPLAPVTINVMHEQEELGEQIPFSFILPPLEGYVFLSERNAPEIYLNAAGVIWSMDTYQSHDGALYLAVGTDGPLQPGKPRRVNQYGIPGTILGVPSSSPNLVSIWEVKLSTQRPTAKLLYAIPHHGGRVFSVAWAPDFIPDAGQQPSKDAPIGLLSVSCADGILRIYLCPSLNACGAAETDQILCIAPLFTAEVDDSIITCSAWNPFDVSLLLTGLSDGSCCSWRLPSFSEIPLHFPIPLELWTHYISISKCVSGNQGRDCVRSVSWNPYERYMFASAGYNEQLCMWDARDPYSGRSMLPPSKARTGTGLAWDPFKHGLFFSQMDTPYLNFFHYKRPLAPLWRALTLPSFIPQHASWGVDTGIFKNYAITVAATPDAEVGLMAYSCIRYAPRFPKTQLARAKKLFGFDSSKPSLFPIRFEFDAEGCADSETGPVITCHISCTSRDHRNPLPAYYSARPPLDALVHSVKLMEGEMISENCPLLWLACGGGSGVVCIALISKCIDAAIKVAV